MHPAHIPFQAEAEAACVYRPGDHGPRSGFLGDGLSVGILPVDHLVELSQKSYGVQVFSTALLIGNPFARLAGVIQIEHGSHGINSQAVGMILVQPE